MWHTSQGDRILSGAEARLFKAAVTDLVETVKDQRDAECGETCSIQLFDDLTWSQKLAVLEHVTTPLLLASPVAPELTAVNEAAIGAVFEHISYRIDIEIDDEPASFLWRQMVLNAYLESFGDKLPSAEDGDTGETDGWLPTSALSEDRSLWHHMVDTLADRILWDRDFEMVGEFIDQPPEKAAMMRQIMGIEDDYFASAAADLGTAKEISATLHRLACVLG